MVIDQHASHERMLFHRLREAHRTRTLAVQPFLIPQVVSLSPGAARALEAHADEIGRLGLEVEHFGGESFAVKGAPAALAGVDVAPLLTDLADQLGELDRGTAVEDAFHHLLATMACHAAVRAHQELGAEEARAAAAVASSGTSVTIALTFGFTRSICFRCASNTSLADSFFLRIKPASDLADWKQRGDAAAAASGVPESERSEIAARRVMQPMLARGCIVASGPSAALRQLQSEITV